MDSCPHCGNDRDLVGRAHVCVPQSPTLASVRKAVRKVQLASAARMVSDPESGTTSYRNHWPQQGKSGAYAGERKAMLRIAQYFQCSHAELCSASASGKAPFPSPRSPQQPATAAAFAVTSGGAGKFERYRDPRFPLPDGS